MTKQHIATIVVAVLLTACGHAAGFVGDPELLGPATRDQTALTVMRVDQFTGSAVIMKVSLDGKLLAHVGPGDFVQIKVPSGERFLLIGEERLGELAVFDAQPGAHEYFRINFIDMETLRLERLTPEDGARELATGGYRELGQRPTGAAR